MMMTMGPGGGEGGKKRSGVVVGLVIFIALGKGVIFENLGGEY